MAAEKVGNPSSIINLVAGVLESSNDGYLLTDMTGEILLINPTLELLLQVERSEVVGRNILEYDILGGARRTWIRNLLKTGEPLHFVENLHELTGLEGMIIVSGNLVRDQEGLPGGVLFTVTPYQKEGPDPTRLMQLAKEVRNQTALAKEMQRRFFPEVFSVGRIRIVTGLLQSQDLSGDIFGLFTPSPDVIELIMGDVVGQGVSSYLFSFDLYSTLSRHLRLDRSLAESLEAANSELCKARGESNRYASMFVARVNVETLEVNFTRAAQPSPLLWSQSNGSIVPLDADSMSYPLGMFEAAPYKAGSRRLEPGDKLVLFSDGLLDVENDKGRRFGQERLAREFFVQRNHSAEEIKDRLLKLVADFAGDKGPLDDSCLIVLEVLKDPVEGTGTPTIATEELHGRILDNIRDAVTVISPDFRILFQNHKSLEQFGDIEGSLCYSAIAGLDAPCPFCRMQDTLELRSNHTADVALKDKYFRFTFGPYLGIDGAQRIVETLSDITEEKRLEDRFIQSEARYQMLVDCMNDAVVNLTFDRIIRSVNEKVRGMLGYEPEEIIGSDFGELFYTEGEYAVFKRDFLTEVQRKGEAIGRVLLKNRVGEMRTVEISGAMLKDRSGNPTGYVATLRDITDEIVLKQRLVQSDKLAEMGQIAAGIAHEIKNPLGIINNAIWAIRKTTDVETVPIGEEIQIIGGEIQRMREIIDSMLTLSRDSKLDREDVDVAELLEMILMLVKKGFKEKGIELNKNFGEVPQIRANRNSMTQMFLNLMLNAGDAMPGGGSLTISLEKDGPDFLLISIADTGQGISPEHIEKIFTPFFTTKPTREGTGLGLSLAYDTVSKHGGEITVQSKENQGTTFLIRLPLDGEAPRGSKDDNP